MRLAVSPAPSSTLRYLCPKRSSFACSAFRITATCLRSVRLSDLLSLRKDRLHSRIVGEHPDCSSPVLWTLYPVQRCLQVGDFCFQRRYALLQVILCHDLPILLSQNWSHPFVTVSSRFRITLATMVQAASSIGVELLVARRLADGQQLRGGLGVLLIRRATARRRSAPARPARARWVAGPSPGGRRTRSAPPARSRPPVSIRSASLRAASTYVGSFISTSACSGVFVRSRRTVHVSRSGASNVLSVGGGTVRFQNVYMPRRYRSAPWLCTYVCAVNSRAEGHLLPQAGRLIGRDARARRSAGSAGR